MPVSTINGVNINWRVVGDRGKDNHPWVVMTTGGRRGHDEFIPLAEKIAAYGYRVMLHDRRNTGASDILIAGDEGEETIWTRDMHALMSEQNALPAFFSGSSAGARTSILFYLNYPQAVRGLLLLRVTGGAFAAGACPRTITASLSARPRKAAWRRSAPWMPGRSASRKIRATANIWQNSRR